MRDISFQGGSTELVFILVGLLVLALLVVAVAYLIHAFTPQGRMEALLEDRAARAKRGPVAVWALRLLTVVLIIGVVAFVADYSGQADQCARCHGEDSAQEVSLAESAHASVDCMDCHRRTGVSGPLRTAGMYARWVYTYAATQADPEPMSGSVEDAACLACHGYITHETTELKGIRVRHSDFLDQGARCRDCHNSVAHPDAVAEPTRPGMSDCIVCHDDEIASADCDVCHVTDPLEYTVSGKSLPTIDDLDTGNCYACHSEKQECLWCHGSTMPHPQGWGPASTAVAQPGLHARPGFTDRETCYRCHYGKNGIFERAQDNCMPCHETPGLMHGGEPWVAEHGLQATGVKGGEFSDCYTCHPGQWFCAACHPASYADRYAPRGGADHYTRDLQQPPGYFDY